MKQANCTLVYRLIAAAGMLMLVTACSTTPPVEIDQGERIGSVERTRPASGNEASSRQAGVPDEREALAQYETLIKEETDPERRAALARRAAELRMQLAATENTPDKGGPEAGTNNWQDSIRLLESSLSPQRGTPGNDEILYQLARAHDLAGQTADAQQALSRLIEEHPRSEYQQEALFRRAEKYFVQADYRAAEADYRRLLSMRGDSPFSTPARHKLGWAIFKQGRYREALQKLLPLLDEQITAGRLNSDGTELRLDGLEAAARERLQDSVRVTVLCYALQGGAQHIPPSLRGHSQTYRTLLYMRLASLYAQRGHSKEAGTILQEFMRLHPEDKAIATARHRMIALMEQSGNTQAALQARAEFVNARKQSTDPRTREQLREDLLYLTRHYHARAQDGAPKKGAAYRQATRWYRTLLEAFPDSHEQRFLLAELMLDHGDHLQAARHFETLGYDTPGFSKARKAAYAALLARRKAGQGAAEAAQRFARHYPEHGETPRILAAAAEDRFAAGQYEQAIGTAAKLLEDRPAHPIQLDMLSLIAHARFELDDYPGSEQSARRWLAQAGESHEERDTIQNLLASSVYRQAQELKKQAQQSGNRQAAIDMLLRLRSLAPADNSAAGKLRASASLQAAQLQLEAQQWAAAITTLQAMRHAFPDHPQQAEVARGLALAYEKQGNQRRAAEEYARVSQASDDPELQRAALYQTAEMHWQAGRLEAARDAFRDYAHGHNKPLDANLKAQQRLVDIYARLDDQRRRNFWLRKIIETDAQAGSRRNDLSRSLAAQAALQLADGQAADYRRTSLGMPLDKGIQRKQAVLEKALQAYGKAADYSVAEVTTAATYNIAELYRDFGRALLNAPLPRDIPADEREEMRILLEDQAFPLEDKAIEFHEANIARYQQGLFDIWVGKSLQALMELVPGRYAKREQGERIVETL